MEENSNIELTFEEAKLLYFELSKQQVHWESVIKTIASKPDLHVYNITQAVNRINVIESIMRKLIRDDFF